MSRSLRIALTAIVLVNLAFVHATDDASFVWLAPMYAAAIASPWLARLSGSAAYRWAWNFAVIGIFAVLVRHTAVSGPRFLLEDGLHLAAVCQVHVLCTLGTRQKPDLLFFNSFLIAVVTAFLTQDQLYSLVFLAYAPLLVIGLSLHAAGGTADAGTVVRDALRRSGFALAATALVFLVWPRDFHRRGLVVEQISIGPAAEALEVGFTDEVRLGRRGESGSSESLVLRATLLAGDAEAVPAYWRGATQLAFDGERWNAGLSDRLGDPRWRESVTRGMVRDVPGDGPVLDVELADASAGRVFAPLSARSIAILSPQPEDPPDMRSDGTLRFSSRDAGRSVRDVRFRLETGGGGPPPGGVTADPAPRQLAPALDLEHCAALPGVARLADELRRRLPAGAPQHDVVETMRAHLAARTDYLPPGSSEGAGDVETFVSGRAGGHCEHFATALALLLRHARIPCRLVTGYMSDDWDEHAQVRTIRRRDAHAWVEVKDPAAGWYTVDPSPATGRVAAHDTSVAAAVQRWFGRTWEAVVRFDDDARDAILAWLAVLPSRASGLARSHPLTSLGAAACVVAAALLVRRRVARRVPAEVREYRACLRRLRLGARPGETPRDVAARAATLGLPRDAVDRLESATRRHEAARYAAGS